MAKNVMAAAGLCLALLVVMLFNANQSAASVWPTFINTRTFQYCNGSTRDCPMAEDDDGVFLADQKIESSFQIETCFLPVRSAVDCGRGRSYTSCLPDPQSSKIRERCSRGTYVNRNRGCAQLVFRQILNPKPELTISLIKFIEVLMSYIASNLSLIVHICVFALALAMSTGGLRSHACNIANKDATSF